MYTLYVKKLSSLNPKQHTFISLTQASEAYATYLFNLKKLPKPTPPKSFDNWLRTEI